MPATGEKVSVMATGTPGGYSPVASDNIPLQSGTNNYAIAFSVLQAAVLAGNAASATILQTSHAINGVSFNGSADITVAAAASTLTGSTLASGVTASSLTSLGTLTSLSVSGATTLSAGSQCILGAAANPSDATGDFIWTPSAAGKKFIFDTSSTQPLVVRQLGGTAGTSEAQLNHDGTNLNVVCKTNIGSLCLYDKNFSASQSLQLQTSSSASYASVNGSSSGLLLGDSSANILAIEHSNYGVRICGSGYSLVWSTGNVSQAAPDTGINRVTAAVVGANAGNTGVGWFADTAGALSLGSSFTDNTGTLTATNFSFPVISGRTYSITGLIRANNTAPTEGFQMDFGGGAATASDFFVVIENTGIGTVVLGTPSSTSISTAVTATTMNGGDIRLTGLLKASATGTIIVRMAEVSHTAGTLTVNADSWIKLEDMRAV